MKAVFIDYSGTITQESGPDIQEVILRCCQNSDLKDPAALIAWWWKRLKEYEIASFQETFLTEDEIVERLLKELEAQYHLRENFSQLHQLFCQIRIPAQLLQHKIQLDIMLSGFLQNLLPVGAERIHINHIGIRQYLPASMKLKRRIHQRSVFL